MDYGVLETEKSSPVSADLDRMSTREAAALMNRMDAEIAAAVQAALPEIAEAADMAAASFRRGGRLIYAGAGTSGRLGVLDASECVPTFGVSPDTVIGRIAGGDTALRYAVEGAEDDEALGAADMEALAVGTNDLVVAISAGGTAAYCLGALRYARAHGARTAGICCVKTPAFAADCDCLITAVVGPEILTGSTRLRAGTATKMILNMISTLSMVRTGKVYKNYMVDVVPTNKKLRDRAVRIVMGACALEREDAEQLLAACGGEVKTAIVSRETGKDAGTARAALAAAGGAVREAILKIKRENA